ncbi:MAG: DUF4293 domain-containing protein [Bacteroidota bacterium]
MIQRIQSIFLLLAGVLAIASLWVPIWQVTNGQELETLGGMEIHSTITGEAEARESQFFGHPAPVHMGLHTGFVALMALSAIVLLFSIFRFQDRKQQMRIVRIGLVGLILGLLSVAVLSQMGPLYAQGGTMTAFPQFGLAFPVLAIVFAWLGFRYIKKDDDLVKSVDRIR